MIKILIKVLFLLSFIYSTCFAEKINNIEITGNKRISDETIKILGEISLDSQFNNSKLNKVLKNLYETNFFNDIQISIENKTLIIKLSENPIIENISYNSIKYGKT